VSEQASTGKINPYQPPSLLGSEPAAAVIEHESIAFAGAADRRDLTELMSSSDQLGWYPIVTGILFLSLLQLWAAIISGPLAIMVAGAVAIVVLIGLTSSRWYRTRVFQAAHPQWSQAVRGELTATGLQIQRVSGSSFYRWNYFAGVVVADRLVAFMPALESESPILIGQGMLPAAVSLDELKTFARSVKVVCENTLDGQEVHSGNQLVMNAPDRDRAIDVPEGAIRFQGMVRGADLNALPGRLRRPTRPLRAKIIRGTLAIALGMIAIGILTFLVQIRLTTITLFVSTLACVILLIAWLRLFRVGASQIANSRELYYLIGHADDTGITTDFFVSVTTCPWSNLRVVDQSDDRLVLSRKMSRQLLITRSDMFSASEDWKAFRKLSRSKTT
jgi:hypothetical protein